MTAKMYYDNDADPAALAGQTVAIIGYGSQGHAHALNLHESGRRRRRRPGAGLQEPRARRGGWPASRWTSPRPCKAADVIIILVPDTAQKAVYDAEIAPNLRPGQLADVRPRLQPALRSDRPAETIDVGMVAPKGPGHLVRSVYQAGGGVPALFAVERDPSVLSVHLAHRPAGPDQVREVVPLLELLPQMRVLVDELLTLGLNQPVDPDRLGDHGRDHTDELCGARVVAIGLEPQIDADHADSSSFNDDGGGDVGKLLSGKLGAVGGAVQEPGLPADTRDDDRLSGFQDLTGDALADAIPDPPSWRNGPG